ncbi:MAG: AsmA-like C-terminal region-containing protein [Chlorobi bacterium]|nr:AsmA-like C-terminal region-containing protein [Chlorobiota bacterium]
MKKFFKIFSIAIFSIFILLLILPFFFKGKIEKLVNEEINNSVNAKVEYTDFSLSLIRNFPNIHVHLDGLTVSGKDKFEGDTLLSLNRFAVVVDVSSVFSDVIQVNDILIDHPSVYAKVLADSTANWDIMKESAEEETEEVDTTASETSVRINSFRIVNGDIVYEDRTMDLTTFINGLNVALTGDLSENNTEISFKGGIDGFTVGMEGTNYLNKVKVGLDAKLNADMDKMLFTFLDNEMTLNGLALGIDGSVQLKDNDAIGTNLTISAKKSDLKTLLALVPEEFMTDLEGVKTTGDFHFVTTVKGDYIDSDHLPAFNVDFNVNNGEIQYPDLPESVNAINIHCVIDNPGGSADATVTDIENFHFELAGNPFDAGMKITNPVSNMTFSGKAVGKINLGSLEKAIPLDSFKISGVITADIEIEGDYEMIDKEEYDKIKSTGSATMKDFFYSDADLPLGINIDDAVMIFSPRYLELKSFNSRIGKSDFSMTGKLENYLAYALKDGVLKGTLSHHSKFIDANELMSMGSEEESVADTSVSELAVVPKNIDFVLMSRVDKILYDKLVITNAKGKITIRNGNVVLDGLLMSLLDGSMNLTGTYSTADVNKPYVDFKIKASSISINKAAESFSVVDSILPFARNARGRVSAGFNFYSRLDSLGDPVLASLSGGGNLKSDGIEVSGTKLQNMLAGMLKNERYKEFVAKDINVNFKLDKGGLSIEPFKTKIYDKEIKIQGRQGLDKTMDYRVDMPVSRKDLAAISGMLGGVVPTKGDDVPVGIIVKGTFDEPEVSLDLDAAKKILGDELSKEADKAIDNLIKDDNVKKQVKDIKKKLGNIFK